NILYLNMTFTINQLITKLGLQEHPEGGFFKETYRSDQMVMLHGKSYPAGTCIYYLLRSYKTTRDFSAWHKLHGIDETWTYHAGSDLTILWIDANAQIVTKKLGAGAQAEFQVHVPKDTWYCAFVEDPSPDAFSLVGGADFPGFDYSFFELAQRDKLTALYPQHGEIIAQFTR
ncbi:MAG: cupin domain-containing protein, partial [Gammaproteobacteria bacterium]